MKTKISGYTTTRNSIEMMYPFEESIQSLLEFCDEVCVVDTSDKNDGTLQKLEELSRQDSRVKLLHLELDWKAPNHGIFDGYTKQKAREMCSGTFLWQQDCDEIAINTDKLHDLLNKWNTTELPPIMALPVIEFWGSTGKVRMDVNCWKWRISLNSPVIVHGIPKELRAVDPSSGLLFAKHGTDTCDYIHKTIGNRLPCANFITNESENLRFAALNGSYQSLKMYENWFQEIADQLPGVYHYSWFNIERKINQYKMFWTDFWMSMYNEQRDEKNNPFFPGKFWSEVSNEEIKEMAKLLENNTGGHIFHKPWTGNKTPHINLKLSHPKVMKDWIRKYENNNK